MARLEFRSTRETEEWRWLVDARLGAYRQLAEAVAIRQGDMSKSGDVHAENLQDHMRELFIFQSMIEHAQLVTSEATRTSLAKLLSANSEYVTTFLRTVAIQGAGEEEARQHEAAKAAFMSVYGECKAGMRRDLVARE